MDDAEIKEIILNRVKFAASAWMAPDAIQEVKLLEHMGEEISIVLKAFVWTQDVGTIRYSHPDGWWQAFKEQHFPKWLKRLYPVKYKNLTFDVDAIYPNFSYACPPEQRVIKIHVKEALNGTM